MAERHKTMKKKDIILKELSRVARQMFGNGEGCVYLYGSQARGEGRRDSDWDILVITEDSFSSADDFAKYAFPYAELGWKYGAQITPLHYTRSQWEAQQGTPFYINVNTEAIRI